MRRVASKQHNSKIYQDRDMRALSRLALLLCCGLALASGFVFAARQHFVAVQYGYQSEVLRLERDRLLQEQQHLLLRKEQAFAPARLESEARQLGLRPVAASQLENQKAGGGRPLPLAQTLLNPSATLRRQ